MLLYATDDIIYTKRNAYIAFRGREAGVSTDETRTQPTWTFLTNHLHVLACVARDPELRIRDIATRVRVTERAATQILSQLESAGYLTKTRIGRRNRYTVHGQLPMRHPQQNRRSVAEILRVIAPEDPPERSGGRKR